MGVCVHHVKAVVYDQFFFTHVVSVWCEEGGKRKNSTCNGLPIHGEHDGANSNSVLHCMCKL